MRALYHHRTQGKEVEAVHIRGVAGGLEKLGYDVEIVGPPGVTVDADVVATVTEGKKGSPWSWVSRNLPQLAFEVLELGYNVVALPRLLLSCRRKRPDVVYERYALFNAAGVMAGRLLRAPVVLEVNETSQVDRTRHGKALALRTLAGAMERSIFNRAAGIVVVSSYLKEQLIELGVPEEKILVLPNAVDPKRFDPKRANGAAVRERHGLVDKKVVGFAGSFAKWHGVDFLIRACASLTVAVPDLRLLLVGDGPNRAPAEALAAELGIADRVVFAGKVPHSEMPDYVAAMDVGVMPASNAHGSPMKVFEYMAMGVPAVAPRYAPLEEAIRDGIHGFLFEPDNMEELSACLFALLVNDHLRQALGAAARRKILNRHLWSHNVQAVADLLARPARPTRTVVTRIRARG